MLKIRDVIEQMQESDYRSLVDSLKRTKAEKFLTLLTLLRQNTCNDIEIRDILGTSQSAYYTLKSRLFDKIQESQADTILGAKDQILKRVELIPKLLYDTPRETSMSILKKLEKDLKENNMPLELAKVYSAMKTLNVNNENFFKYSQVYNKQIAYFLGLEKIEDLVNEFFKYLGNYCLTKDADVVHYLAEIKKQIASYCGLYPSELVEVKKSIVNICFALFIPFDEETEEDQPVEDLLKVVLAASKKENNAHISEFLENVYNMLSFSYYVKHGVVKKAQQNMEPLRKRLPTLIRYRYFFFLGYFFDHRSQVYFRSGRTEELLAENREMFEGFDGVGEDAPNLISGLKNYALSAYFEKDYFESIHLLNTLIRKVSFKNLLYAEVQIKLFLAFCYCFVKNYETAHNITVSISRKLNDVKVKKPYVLEAKLFVKLLNIIIDKKPKELSARIESIYKEIRHAHADQSKSVLDFMHLEIDTLKGLATN